MQQPAGSAALPIEADIEKLTAVLREDMSAPVLAEMANRLLHLAAAEIHPRLRAALLDRAASLCGYADPRRALSLWLESFRLFPDAPVGRRLAALASDDPGFARLRRLGHLVDAVAELSPPAQRVDDLIAATHYHIQQGHGASAQASLAKLAAIAPDHPELLELSEVALQQSESRVEALQAMRVELANAPDDERPRLLVGYADMLLHGDEPLTDAAAVLADAVEAGVSPEEVAPMWVDVARALGDGEELARALSLAIQDEGSPLRLQYADELANLPEIERRHPDGAAAALRVLVAALPQDDGLQARLAVAEAFATGVGAESALEALRLRALQSRDRVRESAACLALAQVAQAAGDAEKAERHFRRVRSLSPQNADALDFFEQWYRRAGDHRRLFAALTQRAAQSEGRILVRIALEMAQLAEGPLAVLDPATATDRAIEAYQRVLSVQPDHMDAIAALERLLTAAHRWSELAALLARSANVFAPRAIIDTSARDFAIAIWSRLAALQADPARLPDPAAALEARLRVLDLDPRQPEALAAVIESLSQTSDWAAVRDTLLTATEAAEDPHELAGLAQQLGEVYRDRLHDADAAATWLDRAAMSEPDRADARLQAQALWRARGDRDRLLDALMTDLRTRWGQHPTQIQDEEAREATPEAEREAVAALLEETAQLAAHGANNETGPQQQAFVGKLWSLLLAIQPGNMNALDALRTLWADNHPQLLLEVLRGQLNKPELTESRRIAVLERLCPLFASTVSDDPDTVDEALAAATQLNQLVPDSPIARTTQLHALVARGDVTALRATYPDDESGAEAFAEAVAAAADDKPLDRQVALLHTAAEAIAKTGQHRRAAELFSDALQAAERMGDPHLRQSVIVTIAESLLQCARTANLVGFERLAIETLATHAPIEQLAGYKEARTTLLVNAGLWSDATAAAAEWVEELLSTERWSELAQALTQLKEAARRAGELETIPHRLLAWADILPAEGAGASQRAQLWLDASQLLLTAGEDLETARHAIDLATEAQPNDPQVLAQRERICTEQADWPAVVATLERLAEGQSATERLDTLLRAANLCDHALSDPTTAAQLYRQVLEETPDALEAWHGLAAALRKSGTLDERADVIDALLTREELSRDARARLALERVDLAYQRNEPEPTSSALAVLARLAATLDADEAGFAPLTDSETAVLGVGLSLLDDLTQAAPVAELLLPLLRQSRGHAVSQEEAERTTYGLVRCLDTLLATTESSPAQREAWLQEAAAASGDPRRAYAATRAQLAQAVTESGLEHLAAVAHAADSDADCNAFLVAIAAGEAPSEVRKHAALLVANRAAETNDAGLAVDAWTLLHHIDPENPEPLNHLAALFSDSGDTEGLEFALRAQTQIGAQEARTAAWLRLVEVHLETLRDPKGAANISHEALDLFPEDPQLWSAHLRALRMANDPLALLSGLQHRLTQPNLAAETRVALLRESAALRDETGDYEGALTLWLQLACDDPDDEEATAHATSDLLHLTSEGLPESLTAAARALSDVLDLRGDQDRLAAILTLRLPHAADVERAPLLERLISLREDADDPAGAYEAAAELLALHPATDVGISRLTRLGQAAGIHQEAIATTLVTAAKHADAPIRAALRDAALAILPDEDATLAARRALAEAALLDDPTHTVWLERAQAWADAADDDTSRLALLNRRIKLAPDKTSQLALQQGAARLAEQIGNADVAREAWTALLSHPDAESRREAAAALVDLHERAGNSAGEAAAVEALRAETVDEESRHALALKAAEAWAAHGDPARALTVLQAQTAEQQGVLDVALYHATSKVLGEGKERTALLEAGWRTVLQDGGDRLAAATEWLTAQVATGDAADWQRLCDVLDAGVSGDSLSDRLAQLATSDDDAVAIAAGTRLAALAAERQDLTAEIAARQAVLGRLEGTDAHAARRLLASLLERAGERSDAVAHLRVILSESWDKELAEKALAWAEGTSEADDVAREVAAAAARGLPERDIASLEGLVGNGDQGDVAGRELLQRAVATPDAAEQAQFVRVILAIAHRYKLEALRTQTVDAIAASPHLAQILSHIAGDPLVAPLQLRAAELALEVAGPEAHAAAVSQLAALRASVSGDVAGALDLLLQRSAGTDLVRALADAQTLAAAHGRLDLWLDAAEDLVGDPDLSPDQRAAIASLAGLAAAEAGEPARAASVWQLVWDDEPDSAQARDHVLTYRRQAGEPAPLAAAIERTMLLGGDVDRGDLRIELASLKSRLGKNREALRLLQDTVASEADRTDVIPVAESLLHDPLLLDETLELLERQYRQHEQWPQLASVLQQRMDRAHRPTSRVALAQALATVQQQHGDVASAAAALMAALKAAPSLDALAALERLCDANIQPNVLVDAYDFMLELDLPENDREIVLRRAIGFDTTRGAPEHAEARLIALVTLRPNDDGAFGQLSELMSSIDRREDLMAAWQARLAAQPTAARQLEGLREIATLARALGHLEMAVDAVQTWSELAPDDAEALEVWSELLRELERPGDLAAVLATLAHVTADPTDRARVLIETARQYEQLGDIDAQQASYEGAFEADPTNDEAFVFLERRAGAAPEKLIPLFARRSDALPAGPSRTLMLRKYANAAAELNDGTTACRALEAAIADDPSNTAVLDELLRIAEQQHEWPTWLRTAEKRLAVETRKEGKASLRRLMARVTLTDQVDANAAAEHIAALEKLAPEDPAVAQFKTMLQARSADPREAAAGLEALLKDTSDTATQTSLHQQLADLYAGPLDNPGKAIRELVKLVQLDPRRWSARRRLCDLYKARNSMEAYAESLRQWLQTLGDSRDANTLSAERIGQLGGLQLELGEALAAVGQVTEAASVLKDALILNGHSARLDAILAQMLEATSDTLGAAELEDWLVSHHALDDREQMAAHAQKAAQLWEQLGEHAKARDAFRRVLEVRQDDPLAMLGQGRACLEMGDTDRALRLFDTVSRNTKASPKLRADALVGMGRCRMSRLALDQARTCYERALQLVPGHRGALDGLSEL